MGIFPEPAPALAGSQTNEQVAGGLATQQINITELEPYFVSTGFFDLMPAAIKMARELNYGQEKMIEAICKVADKLKTDPPTRNRLGWFVAVYKEKLREARADILSFRKRKRLGR